MAKKSKAKSVSLFGWLLLAAAVVGLILAIVGLCVNWFKSVTEGLEPSFIKLFNADLADSATELEISGNLTMAKIFGIVAVVAAGLSALVMLAKTFGLFESNFLLNVILGGCAIAFGILAFSFGAGFAGAFTDKLTASVGAITIKAATVSATTGAILTMVGGILAGAPLVLTAFKK